MPIDEGNADPSYETSCTSVRNRCVGERSSGTGRGLEEVEREIERDLAMSERQTYEILLVGKSSCLSPVRRE